VAVEKDRVRLRLGVDIDPDRRAIVMRPMLDFEGAAAIEGRNRRTRSTIS